MTPEWMEILRVAVEGHGLKAVAKKIGYSVGTISGVLGGSYGKGKNVDLTRIQRAVEGALMGSTVECPIVGEIPRQKCIEHQRAPFRITNPQVVQLYHACRSGCPNSLLPKDKRSES